ncbi:PAS domain S-box [Beggiatoa alba B18LD]|uniref:histidine kinase n=1 Tax=Beggiatoa alba B18LD TaxID=395493 RepID=I3CEQ9_9GAMM|nr:PAS domain S-box protein [Beggiatoa alba]EIJ42102.1 PAS domain S-box [Beggiatoa alba B18LD]
MFSCRQPTINIINELALHILERQQIGYALLDETLMLTHHNDMFALLLNKKDTQLLHQPLFTLIPHLESERQKLDEVAQAQVKEWQIKRFLGAHIDGYVNITIESGKAFGAMLLLTLTQINPPARGQKTNQDVARLTPLLVKYQQAEKALRKSETRFREIVEFSPVGIALTDINGNFIKVNQAFCNMIGYTEMEVLGKNNVLFTHSDDIEKQLLLRQKPLNTETQTYEKRYITKTGEIIWGSITTKLMYDEQGEVQCRLSIIVDITMRKQMEESLRQRSEELANLNIALEAAVHLKDEFLANMSHELRTPLNSILGLTESLQEGIFGVLNEKQLRYLQVINNSGQHLLSLINDILDLSKIETGLFELQFDNVSIDNICQLSLQLIRQQAHKKQLQINYYRDPKARFVYADERRIKQMLINLLTNAVKFTEKGGKIGLEVLSNIQQQTLTFTVWDTGIGIKHKNLDRLFKPFIQLDASLNRQYEGTGLGLAMVSRLASLHGGSVAVESEEGKGSRFSFTLNWRDSMLETPPPPPLTTRASNDIENSDIVDIKTSNAQTVLIAEDNLNNVLVIAEYLSNHGYQVIIAKTGIEALEKAEKSHPDIIIMDIQMPDMDGITAIERLRKCKEFQTIPIIVVTALAMKGDEERCLASGANLYLSKPMTLKKLHYAIETLLQA